MTKNLNLKEIIKQAEQALSGKEFFLHDVARRLNAAVEVYPSDGAVVLMARSINKKLNKSASVEVISQNQIQDLYDEVSGLGNPEIFHDNFSDLLTKHQVESKAYTNPEFISQIRDSGESLDLGTKDLSEKYAQLFDGKIHTSKELQNVQNNIKYDLEGFGLKVASVEHVLNNDNYAMFTAELNLENNVVPVSIPVEIQEGTALIPDTFASAEYNNFVSLNKNNVLGHINSYLKSGQNINIKIAKGILDRKFTKTSSVSFDDVKVDSGVGYYKSASDLEPLANDQIGYFDSPAKASMPESLKPFTATQFEDVLIEASLPYAHDVITHAKAAVSDEIVTAGLNHGKIKVSGKFKGGFILTSNLHGKGGKKAINIPVEIVNNKALLPSTFSSGAQAFNFNAKNLISFANEGEGLPDISLMTGYDSTFTELNEKTLIAASANDFATVGDTLAIISEKFGPEYQKEAFSNVMELMKVAYTNKKSNTSEMYDMAVNINKEAKVRENFIKPSSNLIYLYGKDILGEE